MTLDLLSVGRISVDLYAQDPNHSFSDSQTFMKSIGGSPTNVAVAAARLGLKSALATKVGGDLLAPFVLAKLAGFGVDTSYVGVDPQGLPLLDPVNPADDAGVLAFAEPIRLDMNWTTATFQSTISPSTTPSPISGSSKTNGMNAPRDQ